MNLRHIDPRSTDWMDAMMEADSETGPSTDGDSELSEGEPQISAAAVDRGRQDLLASRPPPRQR